MESRDDLEEKTIIHLLEGCIENYRDQYKIRIRLRSNINYDIYTTISIMYVMHNSKAEISMEP